ncbi:Uncharacterised protein [Roseburia inulinivorans]|uniref:Uncharacterized protein n=1 Tax=Roseburia inulinivorans TaxID=360807 RepID=A0A173UQY9_9FIRM|nr:Uncharacterised protein [Roseburia inulinivorans]
MPPKTVSRRKFAGRDASIAFILLYPSSPSAISATANVALTPAAMANGAASPPVATVSAVRPTTVTRLITPSTILLLLSCFFVIMSSLTALFSASRACASAASCSLSSSSPEGTAAGEESASCTTRADRTSVPASMTMQSSLLSPICMVSFCSPQIIRSCIGFSLSDAIPICVFSFISMPVRDRKPPPSR